MDIVFTVPRDKNTNQQIQEGALLAGIKLIGFTDYLQISPPLSKEYRFHI